MNYGFTLDPGETVTRVIHRHPLDFLPSIIMSGTLALAAAALAYVAARFPENIPFPPVIVLALVTILTIISGLIFLIGYIIFRGNILVFTNIHLVQVERLALFQRRVSQLSFLRVEDVTGRKTGILQTIFDYGNVEVQSAGEQEKFIFRNAPHPELLADEALQIHEQCMLEHRAGED